MQTIFKHTFRFCLWFGLTVLSLIGFGGGGAFSFAYVNLPLADTPAVKKDTLRSPIEDRTQNKVAESVPKRFDLADPKNIKTDIEYNPDEQVYSISERIGSSYYRSPSYMSFEEFLYYQAP